METALNVQDIVDYYDFCQVDYEEFWQLNARLCMHYGYWDATTPNLGSALSAMNVHVASFGGVQPKDIVLDAGCGVGGSSIFLASQLECTTTGISLSNKQVAQCKDNAANHGVAHCTTFETQNYLDTSYEDNTFDVVWAIESVCYAYDKADFLREAFRILKPGGKLVVADFYSHKVVPGSSGDRLMQKWTRTWAIRAYADVDEFWQKMHAVGFVDCRQSDVSQNVIKSIRRLYYLFYPGIIYMSIKYLMRLRTKQNLLNAWSTYYQYHAFRRGLWRYMFYAAVKPN
ncbi:MAG: methyltransferase domain-containing protein [Candidatus Kapabacteria bacterium]|nr:methyltransferase domain-containing protein [Candidatus Kapabacteria bacterium]